MSMMTQRRSGEGLEDRIGTALVEGAFLTREQVGQAREKARAAGRKLTDVLLGEHMLTPETLSTVLSFLLKVPVVDLTQFKIQPEAVAMVPEDIARERGVLPLSLDGDVLRVAMEDPQDVQLIDTLGAVTRKRIKPVLPLRGGLREAIETNYKSTYSMARELNRSMALNNRPEQVVAQREKEISHRLQAEDVVQAPVVKAVQTIIEQAVNNRASDIHVIPTEEKVRVLYRIDGVLHEAVTLPKDIHQALTSRVKVLSGMDIAERRRPQDGQFGAEVEGREINFRVATVETHHGEMMVLRVLDKSVSLRRLQELGLGAGTLTRFQQLLQAPFGMLMVNGPTGSGKTTTLYSALRQLTGQGRNIMTIEDPIEYEFSEVNQIQVNRQAGINFATGLRALMRLDPDIILVGEIRDKETAEIAVQAALTGHLVLTSIHANDSASAIVRLIDMGVEPFLVTSAVIGSVAQRLVRRVCPYCAAAAAGSPDEELAYEQEMGEPKKEFIVGRGCNFCSDTGYLGRIGVYEVLTMTDTVRALVARNASSSEIRAKAVEEGMTSMRRDGMLKVKEGLTTPTEVARSVFTLV